MSAGRYILGLDCGTSVVKAALFDAEGRCAGVRRETFEGVSPRPGWTEYDPAALWTTAAAAIRGALAGAGARAADVAAVSPTGAGNGALLIGADDRPVRHGIFAVDNRAAAMMARDAADGLPGRARPIHGQTSWTGQMANLLRWLRLNEPAAIDRTAKVFAIKDYVKYRLCGRHVGDYSEHSKVGLMDLRRRAFTAELLGLYGIGELAGRLPELAGSPEMVGRVTSGAAAETGLAAGTPVANGLADIDASALGAGVARAGQLSVVAGTWSINQLILDRPIFDERLFGLSHYVVEGLWEELEASPSSTANLTWFVQQCGGDLRAEAERAGESVYDRINRMVASVPAATTDLFFHPYLYGSNVKTNARAGFYGLAGWHGRAEMLAALYEGVAYSHNQHVEKLKALGVPVVEARLSGGAAHSEVWSQLFADAMNLPVAVADAEETGALGAAVCGAVGAGWYPDAAAAAERMARVARRHEPDAARAARCAERYAGYRRITEAMGPVWDEIERTFGRRA